MKWVIRCATAAALVFGLTMLVFATVDYAAPFRLTGQEFYAQRDKPSAVNYVQGVIEGFAVAATETDSSYLFKLLDRIPPGTTPSQIRDITVEYLKRNRSYMNYSAASAVHAALMSTFPEPRN